MSVRSDPADTEHADFGVLVVARAIEVEPRLGVEVELRGPVVDVRRGTGRVLVVPVSGLRRDALGPYLAEIAEGTAGALLVGAIPSGFLASLPERAVVAAVPDLASVDGLYVALDGALDRVELRVSAERRDRWLSRYRYELGELIEISTALSQERDIDRLLSLILEKSRYITGADAGSFYLVEAGAAEGGEKQLRFKLSQNESVAFESREFAVPLNASSIAGAAAFTRQAIHLPDVYAIGADEPYRFDPSFDVRAGYRTRSMIAMPMISAEDEVIGVIQLINKKREPWKPLSLDTVDLDVVEFDERSQDLLAMLTAQAGIALENALLYDEIRRIFEGFVRASVQAIEQRDPTTSGHSLRVSVLSCGLAEAVDRVGVGRYRDARFSRRELKELEYASLLHDFGKIGVREEVLVKAKKLYPHQVELVGLRFDYLHRSRELEALRRRHAARDAAERAAVDEALAAQLSELQQARALVLAANEPSVLREGDFSRIATLGEQTYLDPCGHSHPWLTPEEAASLQVTRGSLHSSEIDEIRAHVVHTIDFLSRIPWGKSFKRVPEIAGAHHEKLDGKGYPRGLRGDAIPLASKIMTIADIYDALTARDRPYKRAIPTERALSILDAEVRDGHIDEELVRIFSEAEVFKAIERDLSY